MSGDYIPKGKLELQIWLTNFATVANANMTALGLTSGDLTALTGYQNALGYSLNGVETAKANLKAAVATETTATKNVTNNVRALVRRIQASGSVSPTMKGQLGINPRNTPHTHTPPVTPIEVMVETGGTGTNTVTWNRTGNKSNTGFLIEARIGGTGAFVQIGATPRVKFLHSGEAPGTLLTYRVSASRNDMISLPSIEVTVNAGTSAPQLTLSKAA